MLRDLDFTPDQRVLVQKISWMDPARNEYEEDTPFEAHIENNTDFSKLRLSDEIKFPEEPRRLVQLRSDEQRRLPRDHRAGAAGRLDLGRAAVLLHRTVRARLCRAGGRPAPAAAAAQGLHQTYQRMVETYHRPWREQEIEEGAILWCDPSTWTTS